MKMLRLELEGFGPFRRPQTIDFTAFAEAGLFLIAGKTGAGKSSILDAISFALYARAPRYEGAPRGIRSNFAGAADKTSVTLEFEHGDEHFRITRSPEYETPKQRGEGTTIRKARQELAQRVDGEWRTIATGVREVAERIREIFPLSDIEFLQVVMLAQNQFQRFLHADSNDRQQLLRKLFHTDRYKTLADLLAERARVSGQRVERVRAALDGYVSALERRRDDPPPAIATAASAPAARESSRIEPGRDITHEWLASFLLLAENARAICANHHRDCVAERDRAAEFLRAQLDLRERQQRRERAMRTRTALLADRPRIEHEVTARLEADAAAGQLLPAVLLAQRAATAHSEAHRTHDLARARLERELEVESAAGRTRLFPGDAPSTRELAEAHRILTEQIGSLRSNERIDAEIESKQREGDRIRARLAAHEDELERVQTRLEAVPHERAQLVGAISTAKERAQGAASAREALERAAAVLAAAETVPEREAAVQRAARDLDSALAASLAAERHERELSNRRWLGAAAHLAEELVPGRPCRVCGAVVHPAPAAGDLAVVSDEALGAAEQQTEAAHERVDRARATRDAAAVLAERARALAGGLDQAAAAEGHRAAEESLDQVNRAESACRELESGLAALERDAKEDARRVTELTAARDEARAECTALDTRVRDLALRARELRGEYTSVAERLQRARALESASGDVLTAAAALEHATSEQEETTAELATVLERSAFTTAEAVLAARLDEQTRSRLTDLRATHDKDLHAAERTLADPQLADLPEAPVETEAATLRAAQAQDRLDAASRALGAASAVLDETRVTVGSARETLAELESIGTRARAERELASAVNGQNERKQNLEAFVLAAYLEEVLDAANARLADITSNRYELELDDELASRGRQSGLGLKIFDVYNGKSRAPKSLSGGETFLVSLALALGLADVVSAQAGGITLDTLFIDEGFGSLDSDTLEIAMRTLDQLREGGRTIGVISHVGSMQERIPGQLQVVVSADGSSDVAAETSPDAR